MGVLEIHPWGARIDRLDRPDRIIFDLDPGEGMAFADVVAAALEVRGVLEKLGLQSVAKTTGGKGLHVVVPLTRKHGWAEVKTFAKHVAERMAEDAPDRYLTKISIAERRGRIFVDYLRNDPTSTAVAPYSTRSRPGAPVATPLLWEEVTPALDPAAITIETLPRRLAELGGDPWSDIGRIKQQLPAGIEI
jgi:bifunctional non-homologous end joining protein LigD